MESYPNARFGTNVTTGQVVSFIKGSQQNDFAREQLKALDIFDDNTFPGIGTLSYDLDRLKEQREGVEDELRESGSGRLKALTVGSDWMKQRGALRSFERSIAKTHGGDIYGLATIDFEKVRNDLGIGDTEYRKIYGRFEESLQLHQEANAERFLELESIKATEVLDSGIKALQRSTFTPDRMTALSAGYKKTKGASSDTEALKALEDVDYAMEKMSESPTAGNMEDLIGSILSVGEKYKNDKDMSGRIGKILQAGIFDRGDPGAVLEDMFTKGWRYGGAGQGVAMGAFPFARKEAGYGTSEGDLAQETEAKKVQDENSYLIATMGKLDEQVDTHFDVDDGSKLLYNASISQKRVLEEIREILKGKSTTGLLSSLFSGKGD
jgi:hypothetical protein